MTVGTTGGLHYSHFHGRKGDGHKLEWRVFKRTATDYKSKIKYEGLGQRHPNFNSTSVRTLEEL